MPPISSRVGSRSSALPDQPSSSRALGRVFLLLLLPFSPPTFPPSGLSVAAAVSHDPANTRRDHATVRKMAAAPRKAAAAAAASPSRGTMSDTNSGELALSPPSGLRVGAAAAQQQGWAEEEKQGEGVGEVEPSLLSEEQQQRPITMMM